MEVRLSMKDGIQVLTLKYSKGEYQKIEEKLLNLGLKEEQTVKGFGKNVKLKYYRNTHDEFGNFLNLGHNVFDDINSPILNSDRTNVALFRVIPDKDKIEISLDRYMDVFEMRNLVDALASSYKKVFNLAKESAFEILAEEGKVSVKPI